MVKDVRQSLTHDAIYFIRRINTSVYKSHTTRAASTSFLVGKQFDIKDIIGAAGSTKEGTSHRFYNRDIVSNFNFGSALLKLVYKIIHGFVEYTVYCYVFFVSILPFPFT